MLRKEFIFPFEQAANGNYLFIFFILDEPIGKRVLEGWVLYICMQIICDLFKEIL